MVKVSLKIQADDSFPWTINWKIHFRYIGQNIFSFPKVVYVAFIFMGVQRGETTCDVGIIINYKLKYTEHFTEHGFK